jgi:opacity protein-like surface antigen
LSALAILPATSADLYRDDGYKDGPAIVSFPGWAGFYAGGHIGGGWGNGRNMTVIGGGGGQGGGGAGDDNWCRTDGINGKCQPGEIDAIKGKQGESASNQTGGANGGAGGNKGLYAPGDARIGGDGGAGGAGGMVTGSTGDRSGILGGLHLGYNWQHQNIVLGAEGDISLNGGLDNYLASLRARLGIASDDMLFYITGGLALRNDGANAVGLYTPGGDGGKGGTNDDGQYGDNPGEGGNANDPTETDGTALGGSGAAGGATGSSQKGVDAGFVVGAGVEYMLSSNISAGVEGLWYSFDDEDDLTVLRARLTLHLDRAAHPGFKDSYMSAAIADWSGFYAGANIGAGFGDGVASLSKESGKSGADGGAGGRDLPPNGIDDGHDDAGGGGGGGGGGAAALVSFNDDAGLLGGFHLGYNWQDDEKVFGIEGDANLGDSSFRDYLASLRLRLGHTFDNVLVYGTAGVAFAGRGGSLQSLALTSGESGKDGEAGFGDNDNPGTYSAPGPDNQSGDGGPGGIGGTTVTTNGDSINKVGFVVGAGFDVKLWENTSLGVEGLYYGFDGDGAKSTATTFTAGDDLSTAIIRARLSFHLQEEHDSLK